MKFRGRGLDLVAALLVGVALVGSAQAEAPAPAPTQVEVAASEGARVDASFTGGRCCSVDDGSCRATTTVCTPDEISVWCHAGERAQMEARGEWTCASADRR